MFYNKFHLQATATGLEEKLGKLAPAYATAGPISQYFVQRLVSIVSSKPDLLKEDDGIGSDTHHE